MSQILGYSKARSWKSLNKHDYLLLLSLGLFLAYCILKIYQNISLDFGIIVPYIYRIDKEGEVVLGALTQGLLTTLRLGFWSMTLGLVIGVVMGSLSAHTRGFAALPARLYTQAIRNTPPLILLFITFFLASYIFTESLLQFEFYLSKCSPWIQETFYALVAPKGKLDIMFAAVITLGLYEGAYITEIIRGSVESIPKEQWEASGSIGFSKWQTIRHIILPQTIKLALPPLIGQSINTFKDSALASIIALPELTFQSVEVMTATNITLELWLVVAGFYFLIAFFLENLGHFFEKRVKWYN